MTSDTKQKIIYRPHPWRQTYQPDSLSNDKLEAATKGHGSLVIPVYAAAKLDSRRYLLLAFPESKQVRRRK